MQACCRLQPKHVQINPLLSQSHVAAAAWPFLFAFGLSLGLVPVVRLLATRFGYIAAQRADRWHQRPVALFGGVAIGADCRDRSGRLRRSTARSACCWPARAMMFATGLARRHRGRCEPSTKLVIQIALASVFLLFGYRLNWTVSLTLDTMLTLVWVVGMTNAFNLLDNMDGLCAGMALIVGAALLVQLLPARRDRRRSSRLAISRSCSAPPPGSSSTTCIPRVDLHGRQRQPAARASASRR